MGKTTRLLKKIIISLIGFPIIILGLILIPLPGPGILISLLGLIILSFEFDWAKQNADRMKGILKEIWDRSQRKVK